MSSPNPDDPLDNNVAEHWKKDEPGAIAKGESKEGEVIVVI